MEPCYFCNLYATLPNEPGGIVYEDERVYAYHNSDNDEPVYLGHLVLVTKQHVPGLAELCPASAQAVGLAIGRLCGALKAGTGAEKIYLEAYYEVHPHVHLHLTARYPGTPEEYWRGKIRHWQGAPTGGPQEVSALCQELRTQLTQAA